MSRTGPTPSRGVVEHRVTVDTADGPMPAFTAAPAEAPAVGGVVVLQEAFGLTDHIRRVTAAVAEAGHLAIAPALYHRSGSPVFGYDDLASVGPVIMALDAPGIAADVDAALAALVERGADPARLGVMGFCLGGTIALATGVRRPLAAAVTFYGGGLTEGRFGLSALVEAAPGLRTPWLGLYGDLDAHIAVDDVEALRVAAATAAVPTEVVRYADADHGFHCDDRAAFHPEASTDAWARTLDFLGTHLA